MFFLGTNMAESNEHVLDNETGSHISESSGDGGACLARHINPYDDTTSCSHRWQAYRQATGDSTWYNFAAYKSLITNSRIAKYKKPIDNSWDLDKTSKVWRTDKNGVKKQLDVKNFRQWCTVPYWHNSHHIIPNGVLNGLLLESSMTDMRLFWLVRVCLLNAKYNLNAKENMILLPMRKYVANVLCLPRHIAGVDCEPSVTPERVNHSKYNSNVRIKVKKVISKFAKDIVAEEHNVKLPKIAKTKLENISKNIYKKLRAWGKKAKGKSLDSMPSSQF